MHAAPPPAPGRAAGFAGPAPVVEGQVLAGKYRVERVLGVGGMGVVVAATHLHLGQRVALKFLLPDLLGDGDLVERFLREARSVVKIQSEHVARVLDVGTLENGAPYIVMEHLNGQDLARRLETRGPLPVEEAVEYVLQACEALAEAHALGIIHRDLKPANLFLSHRADGSACVKVLDFGVSKETLLGEGARALTQTHSVLGSPRYMAPEQLRSARDVDARTDVWSLGIVLHELLTADAPFEAKSVPELYVTILQGEPRPLRAAGRNVPQGLDDAVRRCLQKERAHRYASVAELARALGDFAPARARPSIERIERVLGVVHTPPQPSQTAAAPAQGPPAGLFPEGYPRPRQPSAPPTLGMSPQAHAPGPDYGYGYGHAPLGAPGGNVPAYGQHQQPEPARQQNMHPAWVVLIVLAVLMAFGTGSCVLCVCAAAAS